MTTPGHPGIRSSSSLSSDGRSSSRTSAGSSAYSESNYMNVSVTGGGTSKLVIVSTMEYNYFLI